MITIYIYNNSIIILFWLLIITSVEIKAQTIELEEQSQLTLAKTYLAENKKEEALSIYDKLIKKNKNRPLIHNEYMNLMIIMGEYKKAIHYLNTQLRKEKENIIYELEKISVYAASGKIKTVENQLKSIVNQYHLATNPKLITMVTNYFSYRGMYNYTIEIIKNIRKNAKNKNIYSFNLAQLYKRINNKEKMINEYFNYIDKVDKAFNQSIKNKIINELSGDECFFLFEKKLYKQIQKHPENRLYLDMLVDIKLKQNKKEEAFRIAKSYDKRFKENTWKVYDIAETMRKQKEYTNSTSWFLYIIENYSMLEKEYKKAYWGYLESEKQRIFLSKEKNKIASINLIDRYKYFLEKYPNDTHTHIISLEIARLYYYQLYKKEEAIQKLRKIIQNTDVSKIIRAEAALELGKIYLLENDSWESSIALSQAERIYPANTIAYQAKLLNAKIFYYQGDFLIAQEQLDILKEAVSREIANDAIDLSLKIKENTILDTLGIQLKHYASIELLIYQNKIDSALIEIQHFKNKLKKTNQHENSIYHFGNAMLDDIYWLEATIEVTREAWKRAQTLLDALITECSSSLLVDEAYFLKGKIAEDHQQENLKAIKIYEEFIYKFPVSIYLAEARKRLRKLTVEQEKTKESQL